MEQIAYAVGPRVFILRDRQEAETAQGIVLPDASREYLNTGLIVLAGQARSEFGAIAPSEFEPGMRVVFFPAEALPMRVMGQELWMVEDSAILAVLEPARELNDSSANAQ